MTGQQQPAQAVAAVPADLLYDDPLRWTLYLSLAINYVAWADAMYGILLPVRRLEGQRVHEVRTMTEQEPIMFNYDEGASTDDSTDAPNGGHMTQATMYNADGSRYLPSCDCRACTDTHLQRARAAFAALAAPEQPRPALEVPRFEPFPKIPRLRRAAVITEKLDGTNASVTVLEDGRVLAASRRRWITPDSDNFGFARWVHQHEDELRQGLGVGTHFGEWWGLGIGRGYDLHERRFSLFNTERWGQPGALPACCHLVPVIETTEYFSTVTVAAALLKLRTRGSYAAPGYMRPEGIVVYHKAGNCLFKVTLENDAQPKGEP